MRSYPRQSQSMQHLLNQDVVKVAVKVQEMSPSDRFDGQGLLGLGVATIVVYSLLQFLVNSL